MRTRGKPCNLGEACESMCNCDVCSTQGLGFVLRCGLGCTHLHVSALIYVSCAD